ncbi:a152.2 [Rat cytomegalovirus ALL-03]|uniref:A152.2 n=2 Tax=Rat cytomegalovirus (isolate England) TaxID=1261657 RepID=A0A0F6TG45_RCMVE|nr:a152.2 [Rat cytomegalovirus ALL-03]WEG71928.1 membrane protein e152 [Murid betaherpesvirus 8]WPH25318.1 membrane protein e152 [Murid betaherpesvirus 8]WPH25451.1 membrane protein e152 [Murid betaherpesvirus 8]
MKYMILASYIIYVSYSYTFKLDNSSSSWSCYSFRIHIEFTNDPIKYDFYTLSLDKSFPLVEVTATNKSDHIYSWIPFEEMTLELSFTLGQEEHVKELRKSLGYENDQLVFKYLCGFLHEFSCMFQIGLGDEIILTNNKSKITYADWVNKTMLSKYSQGFGVNSLYVHRVNLKTRWFGICKTLASMDKPLTFAYTYTYHPSQRTVRCTMKTVVPLIYEISIKGTGLTTKYGIYTLFNDEFIFSVSTTLTKGYDTSLVRCEIKSPNGWLVILTQPNDPYVALTKGYHTTPKMTTKFVPKTTARKVTSKLSTSRKITSKLTTSRKITHKITTDHKTTSETVNASITTTSYISNYSDITKISDMTVFKITFGNDSNYQDTNIQSSNEAGVIISVVVLTLVISLIIVIIFRKRLGIRVIDDTIHRLRERLQYTPAGRSAR